MSLSNALINASSHNYMVVSIDKDGLFSMSGRPMFHPTQESALSECQRLAIAAPGKAYVACQLRGGAYLPTSVHTFT